MAYKIGSECISCGSCQATCPVGAISQGADKFEINPEVCISCGACAAPVSYTHLTLPTIA